MIFTLINRITTSISSTGQHQVELKRVIREIPCLGAHWIIAEKYMAAEGLSPRPPFIGDDETMSIVPACYLNPDEHLSYTFHAFTAEELPHYAKQLTKDELTEFLAYAVDIGLHFEKN